METLNILSSIVLFFSASWAVLSPYFNDGLLLKKGLILAAMLSLSSIIRELLQTTEVDAQVALTNTALAIIVYSMVRRRIARKVWAKR